MNQKKLAIIATKGTLDSAYPPFILASTAAALGYEVQIFFTFYGLQLLRKDLGHRTNTQDDFHRLRLCKRHAGLRQPDREPPRFAERRK